MAIYHEGECVLGIHLKKCCTDAWKVKNVRRKKMCRNDTWNVLLCYLYVISWDQTEMAKNIKYWQGRHQIVYSLQMFVFHVFFHHFDIMCNITVNKIPYYKFKLHHYWIVIDENAEKSLRWHLKIMLELLKG